MIEHSPEILASEKKATTPPAYHDKTVSVVPEKRLKINATRPPDLDHQTHLGIRSTLGIANSTAVKNGSTVKLQPSEKEP